MKQEITIIPIAVRKDFFSSTRQRKNKWFLPLTLTRRNNTPERSRKQLVTNVVFSIPVLSESSRAR
jgi:hypothetical protein